MRNRIATLLLLLFLPSTIQAQEVDYSIKLALGIDAPYFFEGELDESSEIDRFEFVAFGDLLSSTAIGTFWNNNLQICRIYVRFSSSRLNSDLGHSVWQGFASIGPSPSDCEIEFEDQDIVFVANNSQVDHGFSFFLEDELHLFSGRTVPSLELDGYDARACMHAYWIPPVSDGNLIHRNVASTFQCNRNLAISLFQNQQLILLPESQLNFSEGRMNVILRQEIGYYVDLRERAGRNELTTEEFMELTSVPSPHTITCILEPGAGEGENSAYYATLRSLEGNRITFDCIPYES